VAGTWGGGCMLRGAAGPPAPARPAAQVSVLDKTKADWSEFKVGPCGGGGLATGHAPTRPHAAGPAGPRRLRKAPRGQPPACDPARPPARPQASHTAVDEELEAHKRSGAAYLEKQDFLKRAELAAYEKERDARLASDVRTRGRL
jgi:hypothetical protein